MEKRRLHPLFESSLKGTDGFLEQKIQIQEKFDPTPKSYTQPISKSNPDISEFLNESKIKMNRFSQKITNIDDRLNDLAQEMRSAHTKLSSRFTERGLHEHKVEALIERQNSIINSFEKKMAQMGKMLESSQLQLLKTQSALEDARKEIAKLKKL